MSYINVYHFPGSNYETQKRLFLKLYNKLESKIPENLSIITIATDEDTMFLCKQLKKNNISYYNDANEYTGEWTNPLKIEFILKSLEKVTTEYVLICDAKDVLIGDLTTILDRLEKVYNKKIVYNASIEQYPKKLIEKIENREDIYGSFKFLNAGVCIGKVEDLKSLYNQALIYKDDNLDEESEQAIIRKVWDNNKDLITIDNYCQLFYKVHNIESVKDCDFVYKIKPKEYNDESV